MHALYGLSAAWAGRESSLAACVYVTRDTYISKKRARARN